MEVSMRGPCSCGSGAPYEQCHGRRGPPSVRLRALAATHGRAALFPFLRPEPADARRFVERTALELGPNDGVILPATVERGLALLGEHERKRLANSYARSQPADWAGLSEAVGDLALARRTLAAGVIRAAIDERRPPPRRVLDDMEAGVAPSASPLEALVLVIHPAGVWSIEDSDEAVEATSNAPVLSAAWGIAVRATARRRLSPEHTQRMRVLGGWLARMLPFEGVPRTSSVLEHACERLERDPPFLFEATCGSLVIYVAHRFALWPGAEASRN